MHRIRSAKFATIVFSFVFAPVCMLAANVADCLIELRLPPTIDGHLEDWKDTPFIICGANSPCEATSAAVVWRGWDRKNFYFAAKVFDEILIGGGDRIDLYFDLRSKDRLGRYPYENGVWHIRILPRTGNSGEPTIEVVDTTGRPDLTKAAQVRYGLQSTKEGWNAEVAVPWSVLEATPESFEAINSTFSIADTDNQNDRPVVLLGTTPPDRRNNPDTDPITFETLSLHETPISIPGFELYFAEAVLNGDPVVHMRACSYDTKYFPDSLSITLGGEHRVSFTLSLLESLAGRFRVVDRYFPLATIRPIDGAVKISVTAENSSPASETLATPIFAERERIDIQVPSSRASPEDPYELLSAYYKELANEASAEMSTDKDPRRIRQRQLRSRTDPKYWAAVIDIFTRWSLRARHHDIPRWLLDYHRVWRGRDGNLNACKITTPSIAESPGGYPLVLEFPYADINNERIRTYFDLLALENGTLEHQQGDAITVKMAGRGRVENGGESDLLGEEEYAFALNECKSRFHVDPEEITFKGHSSGAPDALRYAVAYPGDVSRLDLRAGFFEGPSLAGLSDRGEAMLRERLYSARPYLDVLRSKHPRILVGEYDTQSLDSSRRLARALGAVGCSSELVELPGVGHEFTYPPPSAAEKSADLAWTQAGGRLEGRHRASAVQPTGVLLFGEPWELQMRNNGPTISYDTNNISRVEIDLARLGSIPVVLDAQLLDRSLFGSSQSGVVRLERPTGNDLWRLEPHSTKVVKSWSQPGPALDIRNRSLKIVYGTGTEKIREVLQGRAEAIVRSLTGLGFLEQPNFHCSIVPDTNVSEVDIRGSSLWLLGSADENVLTRRFSKDLGLDPIPNGFRIGLRSFTGKLLASVLRPNGVDQYLLVQMATTPSAYNAAAMPGWQYDFTIVDCSKPFTPALAWGFFDQDWRPTPGLLFSRD